MIIRAPVILCDYCTRLIVRQDIDPDGEFAIFMRDGSIHYCSDECGEDGEEQKRVWAEPSPSK